MEEDKKIWEDFKRGNEEAISRIYCDNIELLYRYGRKFSRDKEIIKDSIQDLFFDMINTRNNLGSTDNIRFYLIKAFRHRLFRNIKRLNPVVDQPYGSDLQPEIVYSVEEEIIIKEEITRRDRKILEGLLEISPRQREILFYRFTCGFSYDQICEVMSLQYDSARKQVFRAIKALKDKLTEQNSV